MKQKIFVVKENRSRMRVSPEIRTTAMSDNDETCQIYLLEGNVIVKINSL